MEQESFLITDSEIFQIKEKIFQKKKELESISKPQWKTNCNIEIFGKKQNLHVSTMGDCHTILSFLLTMQEKSEEASSILGYDDTPFYMGYPLADWIHDVTMRGKILNKKRMEEKFVILNSKLDALLSDDAKREIEIKEIKKLLGGFL
jgi:hypothetical protein